MAPAKAPLFLARRSYRLRRVMDALRLLPLLGLVLFVLPGFFVLRPAHVAVLGLYLFAVWAGLIVVTAILSRRLEHVLAEAGTQPEDRDD
ncbi:MULTISPECIES: hypothetical protein [Thioclava]|uniref:DUF3329 domain-containing protein n=1 Tax=Thioclava kandeliae TaxID=3070818 RepID=A0ABV1SD58_9RHOB